MTAIQPPRAPSPAPRCRAARRWRSARSQPALQEACEHETAPEAKQRKRERDVIKQRALECLGEQEQHQRIADRRHLESDQSIDGAAAKTNERAGDEREGHSSGGDEPRVHGRAPRFFVTCKMGLRLIWWYTSCPRLRSTPRTTKFGVLVVYAIASARRAAAASSSPVASYGTASSSDSARLPAKSCLNSTSKISQLPVIMYLGNRHISSTHPAWSRNAAMC